MKYRNLASISVLISLVMIMYSCERDALISNHELMTDTSVSLKPNHKLELDCFVFRAAGTDVPLGCSWVPEAAVPFPCPEGFYSFGAKAFPITIGNFEGEMSSVVTNLEQSGIGALHLQLVHYFVCEEGTFWTEDQAVCAPVKNDPSICLVNDVLNIVGGTGVFSEASGKLHNHGMLAFDGGVVECGNCFDSNSLAFTGTIDFEIFGRICLAN